MTKMQHPSNEKDKIESKLREEKSNMLRKLDIQIPKAQDENNIIAQNESLNQSNEEEVQQFLAQLLSY